MVIQKLEPDKGFPYDLRAARVDKLALNATNSVFGMKRVASIRNALHRSEMDYDRMIEDLNKYERAHVPSCRDNVVYQLAYQSVREDLNIGTKLIPYTTGAVPLLPEYPRQKSPGLPYKLEGFKSKAEVTDDPDKLGEIRKMWHDIGRGIPHKLPDTCLFAKPMIAKTPDHKIRAVWGYPLAVYIEEARFFYPILNHIKGDNHNLPIAYGFEMANGGMSVIQNMVDRNPASKYLCIDWKGFDKTIPPWLIRDAFALLHELIDMTKVLDSEGNVWNVRPDKSERRWKSLINTPVRTSKGDRFLVTAGVPSGSCFTNILDSIINILVTRFMCYQCTGQFPDDEIYLGDDAVLILKDIVNIEDMANVAKSYFGMELNTTKSTLTSNPRNIHFLEYFNFEGRPFKIQDFLIASFMWTTFDPGYAADWYDVIEYMVDRYDGRLADVEMHLRNNPHRYKFLEHVGYDISKITLPAKTPEGLILEVLPKPRHETNIRLEKLNAKIAQTSKHAVISNLNML
ncbi:hypothetical protein J6590_049796 [Homalodisca vitripennis]|nr:hypothetical protein J6590_049796 [Homalodisca vitripennis]